jgi:lipopolysaccharide transport protein LptA
VFSRKSVILTAVFALIQIGWSGCDSAAAETAPTGERRILITADQLVVDRDADTAEFSQNVTVRRYDGRLTADRVLIYYRDAPKAGRDPGGTGEIKSGIDKMVAEGHVRIETPELTADAERAVYSRSKQTLILSGPNTRIRSANNSVAGSSITLYIDEDKFVVVGDAETRVEAVLTPGKPESAGGK